MGSYAGLSQSAYSRIENGETENLSLNLVEKFAELYKISTVQLLDWDGKISIGTVNGVGVNQGTTYLHTPADDRIKALESKVEQLMEMLRR